MPWEWPKKWQKDKKKKKKNLKSGYYDYAQGLRGGRKKRKTKTKKELKRKTYSQQIENLSRETETTKKEPNVKPRLKIT